MKASLFNRWDSDSGTLVYHVPHNFSNFCNWKPKNIPEGLLQDQTTNQAYITEEGIIHVAITINNVPQSGQTTNKQKQTPCSESASELYWLSDRDTE
jgi:hypothetical protein